MGPGLEALSKPPYEPLLEASLKHLTLKTVFLIAISSAGRHSELRALMFHPKYIQFKPKGVVIIILAHTFMRKIRDLISQQSLWQARYRCPYLPSKSAQILP